MRTQRTVKNVKTNSGFTLVELLVVIAITAVLLLLLVSPLVNSFRLTQRAQMLVAAQDQGRITLENLSRQLGSAAYVFSNTTHSFPDNKPTTNASVPNLQFSNFLLLNTIQNNNGTYTDVPAVAFNAKLDFVLPRHLADGGLIDPTTGQPVTVNPTTGTVTPTSLAFPLAPGTTMMRYWIGLRDPSKPYATLGEGSALATGGDNTYILYRAEFNPTYIDPATGLPKKNPDGSTVYEKLFNPVMVNGTVTNTPEFDDPNFFRNVTTSDVNWLSPTHADYTAAEVTAHNAQVANWFQIAKPVIGIPDVDLILLPHDSSNHIVYDNQGGLFPYPVAHSGAVWDPVSGTPYPVVNSSVTFTFGSISADATGATTSNDAGAGFGGELAAADDGLPYIPTVYTATDQSWAYPYHISLYQYANPSSPTYQTSVAGMTQAFSATSDMYSGDLIEAMYSPTDTNGTPVYDLNNGEALTTTGDYVPMTVTPDTGSISFAMPYLPSPSNPYQRYASLPWSDFDSSTSPALYSNGQVDLSQLPNSPLPSLVSSLPNGPGFVANARIVPSSVRVYGPDGNPGLSAGQSVLYTQITSGDTDFGVDEYMVDYTNNTVTLYIDPATRQLPFGVQPNGAGGTQQVTSPVQITFDYQANLAPSDATQPISSSNPAYPYNVKVDYQTRDLLNINLGIRVYDPNNEGPASVVTVHNQVRIGNSNR